MTENENFDKNVPILFMVKNAGLALLSPWLPRLFVTLGYLNEDRRDFKDDESRIHVIFLLQYLISSEEKEYEEAELMLNRILVSLPIRVPLPKSLTLTDTEKRTAKSLLESVKANWSKMMNTSMRGFQECFIYRTGRLEQQEEKWMLTVDDRGYDLLLESVPWSFRQIRYPWMKEYVQVVWHEK